MSSKSVDSFHPLPGAGAGPVPQINLPGDSGRHKLDLTDDLIAELGGPAGERGSKNSIDLLDGNLERDNWNPFETPRSNILEEGLDGHRADSEEGQSGDQEFAENSFTEERDILEKLELGTKDEARTKPNTGDDTEREAEAAKNLWEEYSPRSNFRSSSREDSSPIFYSNELKNKQLTKLMKYAPNVDLITEEEDHDISFKQHQVWIELITRFTKLYIRSIIKCAQSFQLDQGLLIKVQRTVMQSEKVKYFVAKLRSVRKEMLSHYMRRLRQLCTVEDYSPIQLKPVSENSLNKSKKRESLKLTAWTSSKLDPLLPGANREGYVERLSLKHHAQPVCFTDWRWRNDPFSAVPKSDLGLLQEEIKLSTPRQQKLFQLNGMLSKETSQISTGAKRAENPKLKTNPAGFYSKRKEDPRSSQKMPELDIGEVQFKFGAFNYPSSPSESSAGVSVIRTAAAGSLESGAKLACLRRGLLLLISTHKLIERKLLLSSLRRIFLAESVKAKPPKLIQRQLQPKKSKSRNTSNDLKSQKQLSLISKSQTKLINQPGSSKTHLEHPGYNPGAVNKIPSQKAISFSKPRTSASKLYGSPSPLQSYQRVVKERRRTTSKSQSPLVSRMRSYDSNYEKQLDLISAEATEAPEGSRRTRQTLLQSHMVPQQSTSPRKSLKRSSKRDGHRLGISDSVDGLPTQVKLQSSGLQTMQPRAIKNSRSGVWEESQLDSQPTTSKNGRVEKAEPKAPEKSKGSIITKLTLSKPNPHQSLVFKPQMSKAVSRTSIKQTGLKSANMYILEVPEVKLPRQSQPIVAVAQMKKSATTGSGLVALGQPNSSKGWTKPKSDSKIPEPKSSDTQKLTSTQSTSKFQLEKGQKQFHKSISSSQKLIDRGPDTSLTGRVKKLKTDLPQKSNEMSNLLKAIGAGKSTSYITEVIQRHNEWMDSVDSDIEAQRGSQGLFAD